MEAPNHVIQPDGDVLITLTSPSARWERNPTFLCSGKLLIEASPVFRRSLDGSWGTPERIPGQPQKLEADGFDEQALWKVFRAIHRQHWSLTGIKPHPRTLPLPLDDPDRYMDLPLLAEIAAIVNYYECMDAVAEVAKIWKFDMQLDKYPYYGLTRVAGPWSGFPGEGSDLIERLYPELFPDHMETLIFIAWAFRDAELFSHVTTHAVECLKAPLRGETYPIPDGVIDAINKKRCDAILPVVDTLRTVWARAENITLGECTDGCRDSALEQIDIWLEESGLRLDMQEPFFGYNFRGVWGQMENITTWAYRDDELPSCLHEQVVFKLADMLGRELPYPVWGGTSIHLWEVVSMEPGGSWGGGYDKWMEQVNMYREELEMNMVDVL